ncbi:MAG: tRNA (N(6)-L-threonylcarbamoyladenosine(37)-C(2))-methylthiotransferase MtaB [Candidatus Omnitrophica bacterium]|nr:tRNA (N(6)-L-threonylcarbamoyladenosine(37)-C(2))-methylthiotransferase MtaB [Candidatus Omnitrophota bacterium]MDD5653474.1 tRNA (N(6)-L-threonylcarbamoyladenosine(37)-C(2))-methylthiotransferase MtaB [Candidatus Omnitrophota bacterium]
MKTFKLYTLGCKVNQYESQEIREQLLRLGFAQSNNGKKADLYLINTCTVTGKADSDSLRFIRRAVRENPDARIIVTGCLTELDAKRIKELSGKKLIIRNKDKAHILKFLKLPDELNGLNASGISDFSGHTRAFLKIQDGCNNFCSYCKVPLVRGRSRSRKPAEIIAEAGRLAESGFKEIVLTGICLGAYGKDLHPKSNLTQIIKKLIKIDSLKRIRLSSIEAGDVTSGLIKLMAGSGKICRHLHIPIQSGDDRILRSMRRSYTHAGYLKLIRKIKAKVPGIAITTDCLVGFPGEGKENFFNTVKLVKEILPLRVHIFPYSPRKGTKAFGNKETLPAKEMRERTALLRKVSQECAQKFQKLFSGKEAQVLIESRDKDNPGFWQGHTDNYLKVLVKSRLNLHNKMVKVKLRDLSIDNYFFAKYNEV